MKQQLVQRSSSVSPLQSEMCIAGTPVSHQVAPVAVAACSLPSVNGCVARSDATAPARPSFVEHRESSCEEPMDVEPSAYLPAARKVTGLSDLQPLLSPRDRA